MLHVLESLRVSLKKGIKISFYSTYLLCGKNIFETWLDHFILIITKRLKFWIVNVAPLSKSVAGRKIKFWALKRWLSNLLWNWNVSIVLLALKKLNAPRHKFDADWITIVKKVIMLYSSLTTTFLYFLSNFFNHNRH